MDDDSQTRDEVVERRHCHQPKKRKTIGLFCRSFGHQPNFDSTQSLPNFSSGSSSTGNPTPLTACHASSSMMTTESLSIASRSRLGSSSSSFSTGSSHHGPPRELVGLPDYIMDIPPIPNLQGIDSMEQENDDRHGGRATKLPAIRSLLSIRRQGSLSPRK